MLTSWKIFYESSRDILAAFRVLGTKRNPSEATLTGLEQFVCKLYIPNTHFTQVKEVRWWLFKKKQAQSESLPPTLSALLEGIKRAHYQAMIWEHDTAVNPTLPSPQGYGWELQEMSGHQ